MSDKALGDTAKSILPSMTAANHSIHEQWQCKMCTLLNDKFAAYCEACNNPRDGNNTYNDLQKLVVSPMNQSASQVTFLTSVHIHLCCII